jgi:hypothetical protein
MRLAAIRALLVNDGAIVRAAGPEYRIQSAARTQAALPSSRSRPFLHSAPLRNRHQNGGLDPALDDYLRTVF